MRQKWFYMIPVALFIAATPFLMRGLQLNPTHIESPLVGKQASPFVLPNLQNPTATVSLQDMAGEYALLNVWATWCVGCRQEHDFLLQLARSGMPIYGLNWDDNRADALHWLETLGDPYVATAEDQVGNVAIDYGVFAAPETFLLAPDLTILVKWFGPLNTRIWEEEFLPAIEEHRNRG